MISKCASVLFVVCLMAVTNCMTTQTGSNEHKATILNFDGGSGRLPGQDGRNAEHSLVYRSSYYFASQGVKVDYSGFDFPNQGRGRHQMARMTESHFNTIQRDVQNLKDHGHDHIWLVGLSSGAISVLYAGANQIRGVEGLVIINPPRNIYNPMTRNGNHIDYRKIKLPILIVTHEMDNCGLKNWSDRYCRVVFSSSPNPKMVTFSGGRVGVSSKATHLSGLYQHGLYGLEKEFSKAVIDFIDSNQ